MLACMEEYFSRADRIIGCAHIEKMDPDFMKLGAEERINMRSERSMITG